MPAKADIAAAKVATISAIALGFDAAMRKSGFEITGPLFGIHDWRNPAGFEAALEQAVAESPESGLFMCAPASGSAVVDRGEAVQRASSE